MLWQCSEFMRIAVCESGLGNIRSVVRAIEYAARARRPRVEATGDSDHLRRADVIVVPGQGSFGAMAKALGDGRGMGAALSEAIRSGTPYLGICLGLQILFDASDEADAAAGLGILPGRVKKLVPGASSGAEPRPFPLPHMGWNSVTPTTAGPYGLTERPEYFYFAHSYAAEATTRAACAVTSYGGATFAAAIAEENVLGVQFHPEKSQRAGLALLERFLARV